MKMESLVVAYMMSTFLRAMRHHFD